MTYCLALRLDAGIVFAGDTRTNAGVDYVTNYRKLHVFRPADDRVFVMLAAGSLATTHELLDGIERDLSSAANPSRPYATFPRRRTTSAARVARSRTSIAPRSPRPGFPAKSACCSAGRSPAAVRISC